MKSFILYKAPAIFWTLFILTLLSIPGPSLPSIGIANIDKLEHAGVFFFQALFCYRAFMFPTPIFLLKKITPITATFLLTFLYGSLSEVYQSLIPDRIPDALDAAANTFGLILFGLALYVWEKWKEGKRKE